MQLYLQPQLFLTYVSHTMAYYLFITSLVSLSLQFLQFYSFGSRLPLIISLLQTGVVLFAYRMSAKYSYEQEGVTEGQKRNIKSSVEGSTEDSEVYKFKFLGNTEYGQKITSPLALKLKKETMFWVSAEMKLFIIYNVVVFFLRARSAMEKEINFTDFVEGYVQATETAFYKGINNSQIIIIMNNKNKSLSSQDIYIKKKKTKLIYIIALVVAFGYYGAKYMISAPLSYYSFGNLVLSSISAIAVIPAIFSSFHDAYYFVSLAILLTEIVSLFIFYVQYFIIILLLLIYLILRHLLYMQSRRSILCTKIEKIIKR